MDLSIIIPIYNGASTIGRCLDSIYSQGLSDNQYEIICVDDCSPDPFSVLAITDYKYKGVHPSNLILIKHDVNKRLGGARNTGVRAAKGNWIQFVDCDDFLTPGSLKRVLQIALSKEGLEVLSFDYVIGNDKQTEYNIIQKCNKSQIMTGAEYHICQISPSQAWESLYRRKCFFTNNVWFVENIRFEDLDFILKFEILAKKILYVPIAEYYYVKHAGQITDIGKDKAKIRELLNMCNRVAYLAMELKDKYGKNSEILLGHSGAARMDFLKRDLWKLSFHERLSVLREVRLSFRTGNRYADFTSAYPFATSLLLCFLNQPVVTLSIIAKKVLRRWKIIK